jgi:tRNA-dihydrouridine synthase A
LQDFDGVMIGRAVYNNPYLLADADCFLFGDDHPLPSRHQVLDAFIPYVEEELAQGTRLQAIARHILGLFHGAPGGRLWRRHLSENAAKPGADVSVLLAAAGFSPRPSLRKTSRRQAV